MTLRSDSALLCLLLLLLPASPVKAQSPKRREVRISGDVLAVGLPVASFVTTLMLRDYEGTKELVLGGATALAATYALKYAVGKERPDRSNLRSFPSAHSAVSFQSAAFLQRRYGWKAGIPAYLLSVYVGWSRAYAKKHDIWDVAAGMALGIGSSYIFTRPFARKHRLSVAPGITVGDTPVVHVSFVF